MEYERTSPEQDFLLLNYSEVDFFINRNQFSGSTSLDNVKTIKSSLNYFNEIFTYNNEKILLFDCDSFLKDTFHCTNSNSSRLCLLMNVSDFTAKNSPLIEQLLLKNSILSQNYIGLIITSQAEITKIAIDEIYLSPLCLRPVLNTWGLYGCRFHKENRIQYFIDLEKNIMNTLHRRIE